MSLRERSRLGFDWRTLIVALGGTFVASAVVYPFLPTVGDVSPGLWLVLGVLVGGPGLGLLYGGYRLPRTDVRPELYPTVGKWCVRGVALGLSIAVLILLVSDDGNFVGNSLLLTALGSFAGFGAGTYDARAETRRHELQETIDRLEASNERIERQRQYTDDVLDALDDVFYVVDENGVLKRWNDSLPNVTGYSDEEIAAMAATDFFREEDRESVAAAIRDGFETGSVEIELDLRTKGGETAPFEFVGSRLEDATGDAVLAGIARDVTDRIERERQLERRARQQRAVAELGQSALEADDLDDLMLEASRLVADVLDSEYCKVLDLDANGDELLLRQGVGWDDGLVGEAAVSAVENDSQAAYTLENDHPIVVEDLETETRFGGPDLLRTHDVRSGVSTVIGPFDEPWGILGTHDTEARTFTDEDVTFVQSVANVLAEAIERHRYQAELEQLVADLEESNERLEQFAYAASHDLQEPLRMVSSYLRLIESRADDELTEETREFLEFAVDGADRMRDMIEGLLAYSRVETRGRALEPVDLDDVVADVRTDLDVRIARSDADIRVGELPRVVGDEHQLRQVFQNLLTNAIAYSGDEPPRVEISAERRGSAWEISVRDEGIGIEPDQQERAFEVFQRLQSRDEADGSGIGLALCERIVQRHGGDIWVESEPGEGSTFSFTLPAAETYSEPEPRD
ncbi:ATP-binding protein [Halorubrum sp. CSM-61]|uniref:sensor histidine kinase n=1 Tax=Halorubrum sp. CSM-61 TaxID=2485838 RepID=UPI000F4C7A8A|nr:ATP-binding protein [Halorubrum sp. CSM-61]